MRKFAKISLAAAVAVAGMTSVASAKPLEEAIKGVDATGYVTYQYNDRTVETKGANKKQTSTDNIYKAAITLTIPATDDVAVKVTGVTRGATTTADANPTTNLAHANFVYTGVENLTVIAGKQALNTPWTQGSSNIDKTQNGTGALALYNAGFATIAAGHFTNNGISSDNDANVNITDNDITVAAVIAPIADVATAQVWYAKVAKASKAALADGTTPASTLKDGAKALSMSVDANLMDVAKLAVTHSTFKSENVASNKTQKLTKATLSGSVDIVNLAAAYAKTGKDGGHVAFDSDASAGFKGYSADLMAKQDAKAYLLSANVNVMPELNLALTYIDGDIKGAAGTVKTDLNEWYAQATYKFASNLSAFVRYGVYETKQGTTKTETNRGRLQIAYSF